MYLLQNKSYGKVCTSEFLSVHECKKVMQLFCDSVLQSCDKGRFLMTVYSFKGKDEINQAVCTADLLLY